MYNTPIGARFIVASKNFSIKSLSDTTPKIFKMIFSTLESVYNKSFFIHAVKNSGLCKILFQ